jgi:hypothetical protein
LFPNMVSNSVSNWSDTIGFTFANKKSSQFGFRAYKLEYVPITAGFPEAA